MRAPSEAWIVWDMTVPAVMQTGPIGTEHNVREEVRKKEAWRRTQPSCKHERWPRYEAKRLLTE